MWERVRNEIREIGLVTLYFLCCFALFLGLKRLFLEEYDVGTAVLGTTVVSALIVAKVVILLDKTRLGGLFQSRSFWAHVMWRSLSYTAMVVVVTFAEKVFEGWRETGALDTGFAHFWAGRNVYHFVAMNLVVAVSFVAYNTFNELDRRLGEGTLRSILFSRGAD